MTISFACECGKHLKTPDRMAGKLAQCPRCGRTVTVSAGMVDEPTYALEIEPDASAPHAPSSPVTSTARQTGTTVSDSIRHPTVYATDDRHQRRFRVLGVDFSWASTAVAAVLLVIGTGTVIWYMNAKVESSRTIPVATASADETDGPKEPPKERGFLGALAQAQHLTRGVVSMNSMRQIAIAFQLFVEDNGDLPNDLIQLRTYIGAYDQIMFNQRTGDDPGFIYEKPPLNADPATTPILFESKGGKKDPDGSILYLDGHIARGK